MEKIESDRIEIKLYTPNLKKRFKEVCKENNTSMKEVLEKAIRKFIQENSK